MQNSQEPSNCSDPVAYYLLYGLLDANCHRRFPTAKSLLNLTCLDAGLPGKQQPHGAL